MSRSGADEAGTIGARAADDLSTFVSLAGDFYRGEIDRTTAWRARLDQTTNWAVVVMAAILTWVFSSPDNPHYVLLIGMFAVTAFLFMEANRYREYDVWRSRVRLLQRDLFGELYAPSAGKDRDDWRRELGEDLLRPSFPLPYREALAHRLRRVYFPLLLILLAAWIVRVAVFEPGSWRQGARLVGIPGIVVVAVVAVFYLVLGGVTIVSSFGDTVEEFEK